MRESNETSPHVCRWFQEVALFCQPTNTEEPAVRAAVLTEPRTFCFYLLVVCFTAGETCLKKRKQQTDKCLEFLRTCVLPSACLRPGDPGQSNQHQMMQYHHI